MQGFGICTLAALSMRTEPSDKSELCNQLLFGELYTVLSMSENGAWLFIESEWDTYKGWISAVSHTAVSEAYFVRYRLGIHAISLEPVGKLFLAGQRYPTLLAYGATLPFWDKKTVDLDTKRAQCTAKAQVGKPENSKNIWLNGIIAYLNAPYLWGGRTPLGIDCSGFTQNLYKPLQIRLERDAYQQAEQGKPVSIQEAQTGDLAFFHREGRIVHVGMVVAPIDLPALDVKLPKDKKLAIVHARDTVRIDILDETGILHLNQGIYTHYLASIRRFC